MASTKKLRAALIQLRATRSVVASSVLILALDYFLTQLTLVILRPGQ